MVAEQGQAIAAAQQLAAEAQTLGVKVDREVEKLREVRLSYEIPVKARYDYSSVPGVV